MTVVGSELWALSEKREVGRLRLWGARLLVAFLLVFGGYVSPTAPYRTIGALFAGFGIYALLLFPLSNPRQMATEAGGGR